MPRPSRNIDQRLIDAALELMPTTGTRALSIRRICEHAGVNLGMFHYHFKAKDVFLRAVLQQMYDGMFATLVIEVQRQSEPEENLRAAIMTLALFSRDRRHLLMRLINDALMGETIAMEFLQRNLARHVGLVVTLISAAQRDGTLRPMPPLEAFAFLVGGVGAPLLLGTAATDGGMLPVALAAQFESVCLTDEAIATRVEMALAGLAQPTTRNTKSGGRK